MSYGSPEWQAWVLGEEEGIAQIKYACVIFQIGALQVFDFGRNRYENGIQTFDTANVSSPIHFSTCRIL